MKEEVNHPDHYNQIKNVECIDVVEQMSFNLGNAVKYIWRCDSKGNKLKDLQKAIWYLNREIERTCKPVGAEEPEEIVDLSRTVCEHCYPVEYICPECANGR